jgi:hypothetical protein
MNGSGKFFIGSVLLISAAVVAYNIYYPTYSYRVRLSVEVEQNGERKVGSSVKRTICPSP